MSHFGFGRILMGCVLCCAFAAHAIDVSDATETAALAPFITANETRDTTIHKSTAEVDLLVTVIDQQHRPMMNLGPADFTIVDGGAPVSSFIDFRVNTDLPLRLGVLIDRSDSIGTQFELQKQAALRLIQRVLRSGDDKFFVGSFDARADARHPLTNDTTALLVAADSVKKGGLTALYDAVYDGALNLEKERENVTLRKALILFSDGEDTFSLHGLGEAIAAAQRAGVSIYSIGMKHKGRSPGDAILQSLSKETGGMAFVSVDPRTLE